MPTENSHFSSRRRFSIRKIAKAISNIDGWHLYLLIFIVAIWIVLYQVSLSREHRQNISSLVQWAKASGVSDAPEVEKGDPPNQLPRGTYALWITGEMANDVSLIGFPYQDKYSVQGNWGFVGGSASSFQKADYLILLRPYRRRNSEFSYNLTVTRGKYTSTSAKTDHKVCYSYSAWVVDKATGRVEASKKFDDPEQWEIEDVNERVECYPNAELHLWLQRIGLVLDADSVPEKERKLTDK